MDAVLNNKSPLGQITERDLASYSEKKKISTIAVYFYLVFFFFFATLLLGTEKVSPFSLLSEHPAC